MKTNILNTMKQFAKYICAVVVMLGMSVSAWGTMYIEYGGNTYDPGDVIPVTFDQSEYDYNYVLDNITLTLKNSSPGWTAASGSGYTYGYMQYACSTTDVEWYFYIEDGYDSYKNSNQYGSQSVIVGFGSSVAGTFDGTLTIKENDYYNGTALQSGTFTLRVTVTAACTQLGTASSLAVNTRYDDSGTEKVRFTWTRGSNVADHADNQKFCYWPIDGDATCTSALTKSYTSGKITRSTLSTGHYGWSIQALGSGDYCNSDAAESEFCIDDVDQATPGGADGKSWTGSTLSLTSKRIGWTAISNAEYYIVNIINKSTSATIGSADREITTNSIDITGLTANVTYTISVVAYNACDDASNTGSVDFGITAYTVSFNLNGEGSNAPSSQMVVKNGKASTPSAPTPPTGKHLDGWYKEEGCTNEWDFSTDVVTANTTLYAKWVVNNYTISFNSNGGSGSMSSVEKAYNSSYSLPSCTFTPPSGKVFDHWGAGSAGGTSYDVDDSYTVTGDITFYAVWKDGTPTDLVFSCAELEITGPTGNLIFITSAASKTVRSQEAFHIEGSGLSVSQSITFTHSNSTIASKFAYKTSDGTALATDASGEIDTDFYIYYTPDEGDTDDGLDVFTNLQAKVTEGLKPKASNILSTKTVMGRHLPADFVIAGKKDGKWWAMPSDMASTTNPKPSEIAVDDFNNPSVAYTDASNKYGLAAPTASNISGGNGQYIRLTMSIEDGNDPAGPAPLFGSATGTRTLGKSNNAKATSDLSAGWWWQLKQTNTSITNPQDAKYTIYCANNTSSLSLRDNAGNPDWGLFASGVEELRLIPASDIPFTEAYFIEWGQHGGVIEVDAEGIDATSVVAHLGAVTSSAITLSQTLTNGKSRASIYDYTVNFGNDINFAAAESNGALLTLEWKNGETVKAVTNIVVPKIIATSATMKSIMSDDAIWETEVHVLPGVTLTANAGDFLSNDVMIKHLEIYPGATVVVTKGSQASGTLKVKTLVLRNGWTRAGAKRYDVARLYITPTTASLDKNASDDVWYADWYIDYDQYYPIAVPWDVTLANITYRYCSVEPTVGHDKNIRLRYYDGSSRAGGGAIGTNWKLYGAAGAESVPTKLEPSKGYALTAKRPSGKAFSILRMPLTIPSADWTAGGEKGEVSPVHKNQVSVTGWGSGTAQWYAMGWNFIGNPYMCTFNGNDDGISGKLVDQQGKGVRYATIPDVDFKNFDQVAIADADLKPASGFFVQAENPEATYITFASSNIVPPSAPARFTTVTENIPDQEAYIRLSYEGGKDQMGLIIGEDYTANYEVNADLAKVLGDAGFVKTYMQYGGMDMAYVAINEMLAKEWIPVTVILPANGEYTYSLTNSSIVDELEGVYLIDYANNDQITNLIDENYTFTAEAGTINNRFAINAIVGERQIPTDIDVVNVGGDLSSEKPFKFIYHEKVYIYHRGIIYDATGKRVKEINK